MEIARNGKFGANYADNNRSASLLLRVRSRKTNETWSSKDELHISKCKTKISLQIN